MKSVIVGHFLPFYPPKNLKNQNFEKLQKLNGDIINLLMCTQNHNHMMYGSWVMEWDRQNILSFQPIFCLFTPWTICKIKIKKKMKKDLEIFWLTLVYHKWQSYCVWCLRYGEQQTEFSVILDHFLPFYTTNNLKNYKFQKI